MWPQLVINPGFTSDVLVDFGRSWLGRLSWNKPKQTKHATQTENFRRTCFFKGFRLSAEPCASCGSGWSLLRCSGASTWRRRSTLEERVLQVARIRADIFMIWLILLIPLIRLTNPNKFGRSRSAGGDAAACSSNSLGMRSC